MNASLKKASGDCGGSTTTSNIFSKKYTITVRSFAARSTEAEALGNVLLAHISEAEVKGPKTPPGAGSPDLPDPEPAPAGG